MIEISDIEVQLIQWLFHIVSMYGFDQTVISDAIEWLNGNHSVNVEIYELIMGTIDLWLKASYDNETWYG